MQVKFYLNNTGKTSTIFGVLFAYNNRYKVATRIKVTSRFWNSRTYRLRETFDYPDAPVINAKLDSWSDLIEHTFKTIDTGAIPPTQNEFKAAISKALDKSGQSEDDAGKLLPYARQWVKSVSRADRTIIRTQTVINILARFEKQYGQITFARIGMDWYNQVKKWMEGKDYSVNIIGEIFKTVKTLMDDAKDDGLHTNFSYKHRDFRVISEESDSIYLSVEELTKIHDLKIDYDLLLDHFPDIRKVKGNINRRLRSLLDIRDRFLIGAFTGLRFQDYRALEIRPGAKEISVRNMKTGIRTTVPMHYIIREIVERRNGIIPPASSNQKTNKALKILGKIAGIDELVETSITKGGKRRSSITEKYNLITTHTARRSACTNMYLSGIPTKVIMSFSGHRTERNFLKYIKVKQFEDALRMKDHPFFTGL